jgi:asparagine synthase (glutamine-hydrolysing)
MCGIVGIVGKDPIRNRGWLVAGRDEMRHRGPDDAGEWWSPDGCVGLGHRRLSIIDLSPAGHQPMVDSSGTILIVFNGEIYNFTDLRRELLAAGHHFRSGSDTEVILEAYREWGSDCLGHLNGMFAFGLYDSRKRQLLLARDRAGEKPLFYAMDGGTLRFASELKGLMADPELVRRIEPQALDCYLSMGFIPSPHCILHGVNKLPPAHALVFDLATTQSRVWRYWRPPEPNTLGDAQDEVSLLDQLETLLEDAVRRQLVADVPVGVLLSGGVDSSLVTAMAVRAEPKVKTFTVRFPGHGQYDETEHARLIARHFGTEHVELDAGEVTVDLLPMLARQFDEPMVDSSMIPTYLLSRLVRKHCTVALGGDGGDELFAGYPHYNRLLWMRARLGGIPRSGRRLVATVGKAMLPLGFRGRNWLGGLGVDMRQSLPLVSACFDRDWRQRLMARRPGWNLVAESIREARIPRTPDLLFRTTCMDFENYLAEDILVKVDRASMLNSLEVRAPLLDYRLIEFAFGRVPSDLKATTSTRKVLLKKLAARLLPPEFDQQRKQGFSIPLASWLRKGAWADYFREVLLSSDGQLFDRGAVRNLLKGQERGVRNSERLFALVLLELWRREYRVSL